MYVEREKEKDFVNFIGLCMCVWKVSQIVWVSQWTFKCCWTEIVESVSSPSPLFSLWWVWGWVLGLVWGIAVALGTTCRSLCLLLGDFMLSARKSVSPFNWTPTHAHSAHTHTHTHTHTQSSLSIGVCQLINSENKMLIAKQILNEWMMLFMASRISHPSSYTWHAITGSVPYGYIK